MTPFFLTEHFVASKLGNSTVLGSGFGTFPNNTVFRSTTVGSGGPPWSVF